MTNGEQKSLEGLVTLEDDDSYTVLLILQHPGVLHFEFKRSIEL